VFTGMEDEDEKPKSKEEPEVYFLTERDIAKMERQKRKEERTRMVSQPNSTVNCV